MTKSELIHMASRHCLTKCDIEDAVRFVYDLIYARAKELKETEPYATVTIGRLLDAALEVNDLENYVEEIMESDEDED